MCQSLDRRMPWRRCLSVAATVCIAVSLLPQTAYALPTEVHAIISFEAAKLPGVPEDFHNQDVLGRPDASDPQDQDSTICQGSIDEDADRVPDSLLQLIRFLDPNSLWSWGTHFWNPIAGPEAGQLLLLNPPPAKNAYQRGRMLYEEALTAYPVDPSQAWYLLGRVAHLLEDMATPAHTHLDPHVSDGLAAFLRMPDLAADSFEEYLSRTYVTNPAGPGIAAGQLRFEQDWVPDTLDPVPVASLGSAGHPELGDLFKLFNSMARWSVRWDSNDVDGTGAAGIGGGSLRNDHHISDADCQRMAGDLMPKAVAHVAALYRLFWRDTHPEEALPSIGPFAGDIDKDGGVGVLDLLRLVAAFGTSIGDDHFDAACDLDVSGTVDVADLRVLIHDFGRGQ